MSMRKNTPLHDKWHRRVEGQIRDVMMQHPDWFAALSDADNIHRINSIAKRIVGEIVADCKLATVDDKVVVTAESINESSVLRMEDSNGMVTPHCHPVQHLLAFLEADLDPMALTVLRQNQRQLDYDGIEVGVSRQALDMAIAHIDKAECIAPEILELLRAYKEAVGALHKVDKQLRILIPKGSMVNDERMALIASSGAIDLAAPYAELLGRV